MSHSYPIGPFLQAVPTGPSPYSHALSDVGINSTTLMSVFPPCFHPMEGWWKPTPLQELPECDFPRKKGVSPSTPSPRIPSCWDERRSPPAKACPHLLNPGSHVRRGGSLSLLLSLHARNSYRPQPGAGAPRGRWEPQPRRGAAPWEPRPDPGTRPAPGAAGSHLQDTAAQMKSRSRTFLWSDGK